MAKHEKQRTQEPTTLSTRFTPAETEMLRKAAEAKGWSLSKLLRVGAYEKAVHILNLKGEAINPLRRVLAEVVCQLFDAELRDDCEGGAASHVYEVMSEGEVEISSLALTTFLDFVTAIENVGEELAPILEEERLRLATQQTPGGDLRSKLISPGMLRPDSELEPDSTSESKAPPRGSKKSGKKSTKKKT